MSEDKYKVAFEAAKVFIDSQGFGHNITEKTYIAWEKYQEELKKLERPRKSYTFQECIDGEDSRCQ